MGHEKYFGWFSALGLFIFVVLLLYLNLGFGLVVGLTIFTVCRKFWTVLPQALPPHIRKIATVLFLLFSIIFLGWAAGQGMRYGVKTLGAQKDQMVAYSVVAISDVKAYVPKAVARHFPKDTEDVNALIDEAGTLFGKNALGFGATGMFLLFQFIFALLIAGTCCTRPAINSRQNNPLLSEWLARIQEYSNCFSTLMTAQMYVALWNAFCTAIFLYAVLPLMGVSLSFREAMIIFTLFVSLIPAFGNIVANTVMAFLCLPHGGGVVFAAVVFLFMVHKIEYIINARIIGQKVRASVPEMLIALLIGERLFGLTGLILAPVTYAFLKMYLMRKQLV